MARKNFGSFVMSAESQPYLLNTILYWEVNKKVRENNNKKRYSFIISDFH